MTRILLIGYGNDLRGDDGLGWVVAQHLAETLQCPDVEVLPVHQLYPELAESISRAEFVIFVDAREGDHPGELHYARMTAPPINADEHIQAGSSAFTHFVDPGLLTLAARDLYGARPQAIMLSVTGIAFDFQEELSPEIQQTIPILLDYIQTLIDRHLSRQGATA